MPFVLDWKEDNEIVTVVVTWKTKKLPDTFVLTDWFFRLNVLGEGVEMVDFHEEVNAPGSQRLLEEGRLEIRLEKKIQKLWNRLKNTKKKRKKRK